MTVPVSPSAGPATVPPFDQVAVAVAPGDDLVVRLPGMVLVVAAETNPTPPAPPTPPTPSLGGWTTSASPPMAPAAPDVTANERTAGLIGLCRRVSAEGSRAPGRRLLEELRPWLRSVTGVPSFALVAATEAGLAVALSGDGVAEVPELGLKLRATHGGVPGGGRPPMLERLVDWPPAALRLAAGTADAMAPHPLADLVSGAVPGSAAVLSATSAPAPTQGTSGPAPTALVRLPAPGQFLAPVSASTPQVPASPPILRPPQHLAATPALPDTQEHRPDRLAREQAAPDHAGHDHPAHDHAGHDHPGHDHASQHAAPAEVLPPPADPLPPPARSASLLAPPPAPEQPRQPLPVVAGEQPPAALAREPEDPRPRVKGFLCSRGHLNDPRVHFCAQCGIRMAERTGVFLEGIRPPLGLLVFDNGATVSLDAPYLLGREPETDDRVRRGELRPLLVVDQTGGVSRHHAEVRLEGWDVVVVDTGSANGTLVAAMGAPSWSTLVPGQPVRLTPGMAVRLGSRQFAFQSPHGGF